MKFFTGYEDAKERTKWSDASGFKCVGDSVTVQADAKDADINVIMDRYAKTGQFPGLTRVPSYGDFDGVSDFREALHLISEAEDAFMSLPAKLRADFDNDAVKFVEYCDTATREDLEERGILRKEVVREAEAKAEVKSRPTDGVRGRAAPVEPSGARKGGVEPKSAEGGEDH